LSHRTGTKGLRQQWIDAHPAVQGIWDVFEVQLGLDVIISIHQPDGVRRLTLTDQQTAPTLKPEVESRILNWLDNLSSQPTV
jgi:L-rhamnose isomerase